MVRYCVYRDCKSRERNETKKKCALQASNSETTRFFPVPKPTTEYEKCVRWLRAIKRPEIHTTNVKKHHYVCSKHFVGGFGPTIDNPDPIFNSEECLALEEPQPVVQTPLDNFSLEKLETPTPIILDTEIKDAMSLDSDCEEVMPVVETPLDNISLEKFITPNQIILDTEIKGETSFDFDCEEVMPVVQTPLDNISLEKFITPTQIILHTEIKGETSLDFDCEDVMAVVETPLDNISLEKFITPTQIISDTEIKGETSLDCDCEEVMPVVEIPLDNISLEKFITPTQIILDTEIKGETSLDCDCEEVMPVVQTPLDNISLEKLMTPTPIILHTEIKGDTSLDSDCEEVMIIEGSNECSVLQEIPIIVIEDPEDRETLIPPIESLGQLAKTFLYHHSINMESIIWSMEIKRETSKNLDSITSLVFKNSELMKFIVKPTMTITVMVCDEEIPDSHVALNSSSVNFKEPIKSLGALIDILFELENWNCCRGIRGDLYDLFKGGYLKSIYVCSSSQSLRSEKCQKLLIEEHELCWNCRLSKKVLQRRKQREMKRPMILNPNKKFINKRFFNAQLFHEKCDSLHAKSSIQKRKIKQMEEKIKKSYRNEGIFMSREDCADFEDILRKNPFPSKTVFQKLLLREQIKLNTLEKTKPCKWHPTIINWCHSIKAKSPTMNEALRLLPSKRTLFNHSSNMQPRVVLKRLRCQI